MHIDAAGKQFDKSRERPLIGRILPMKNIVSNLPEHPSPIYLIVYVHLPMLGCHGIKQLKQITGLPIVILTLLITVVVHCNS